MEGVGCWAELGGAVAEDGEEGAVSGDGGFGKKRGCLEKLESEGRSM